MASHDRDIPCFLVRAMAHFKLLRIGMARATYLAEVIAMKRFVFSAVLLISALLAAESGNVSYIQFMENEGTIIPADKPEKIAAQVNYPLYPGDVVDTQSQGRMELALADGNLLWLDSSTSAEMRGLFRTDGFSDQRTYIYFKAGQGAFEVVEDPPEDAEPVLGFAGGDFYMYSAGLYGIELRGRQVHLRIYSGRGELVTDRGSVLLQAGEEAVAREDGYADRHRLRDDGSDFAAWVEARRAKRLHSTSSTYTGEELSSYSYMLDDYGSWVYMPSLSLYAWRPVVDVGWQPFFDGRWNWSHHGWFWVGMEPWGYVTHHYGRWIMDPAMGWIWVPGAYWAPGWVDWYWDDDYIGWCPMGYFDYWWFLGWPGIWDNDPHCWHQNCYHNFHGHAVFGHMDHRPFVFVGARNFGGLHPKLVRGAEFKGNFQAEGAIRALTLPVKERDLANISGVLKQTRLETGADLTPLFKREPKLGAEFRTLLSTARTELSPRGTRIPQPEKTVYSNRVFHSPATPTPDHGSLPRTPIHHSRPRSEAFDQTPSDRPYRSIDRPAAQTPAGAPREGGEASPKRYTVGQPSPSNHAAPSGSYTAPHTGSSPSAGSAPTPGVAAPSTAGPKTVPNKRASLDAGGRDVIVAQGNTSASHSNGTASVTQNYYNARRPRVRPNTNASTMGSSAGDNAASFSRTPVTPSHAPVSNYARPAYRPSEGTYSRAPVAHFDAPSYQPSGGSYSHSSSSYGSSHSSSSTSTSRTSASTSHSSHASSSSSSHQSSSHHK